MSPMKWQMRLVPMRLPVAAPLICGKWKVGGIEKVLQCEIMFGQVKESVS